MKLKYITETIFIEIEIHYSVTCCKHLIIELICNQILFDQSVQKILIANKFTSLRGGNVGLRKTQNLKPVTTPNGKEEDFVSD